MWNRLQIDSEVYFMKITFETDEAKCILYDLNKSWISKLSKDEVLKSVKELNTRIPFDEATIRETFQHVRVEAADWLDTSAAGPARENEKKLLLRYRVSTYPLKFEWKLYQQTAEELQKYFLLPLFQLLYGLSQQVEELQQVVRKKDSELDQYRDGGVVLRQPTLRYDFNAFADKFAETIRAANSLQQISEFVASRSKETEYVDKPTISRDSLPNVKIEGQQKSKTSKPTQKRSPRNRKRKVFEEQRQQIERKLKLGKKKLEYESSQSLSQSDIESKIVVKKERDIINEETVLPSIKQDIDKDTDVPEEPSTSAEAALAHSLMDVSSKSLKLRADQEKVILSTPRNSIKNVAPQKKSLKARLNNKSSNQYLSTISSTESEEFKFLDSQPKITNHQQIHDYISKSFEEKTGSQDPEQPSTSANTRLSDTLRNRQSSKRKSLPESEEFAFIPSKSIKDNKRKKILECEKPSSSSKARLNDALKNTENKKEPPLKDEEKTCITSKSTKLNKNRVSHLVKDICDDVNESLRMLENRYSQDQESQKALKEIHTSNLLKVGKGKESLSNSIKKKQNDRQTSELASEPFDFIVSDSATSVKEKTQKSLPFVEETPKTQRNPKLESNSSDNSSRRTSPRFRKEKDSVNNNQSQNVIEKTELVPKKKSDESKICNVNELLAGIQNFFEDFEKRKFELF